jgi:hypothetical protein
MKVFDAQAALGFVISQTAHIEAGVYAIKYADIQYPQLIPVDTSAHPFAKTVQYFSSDKAGVAGWINGNSDDIPMADTEMTQFETSVYTAGIGYGYGWEEINQAQMLGIGLANDKANAARRASEEMIDRVAMEGDDLKNFQGLIDHSAVTATGATNGDWEGGSTTPDEIIQDVNQGLSNVQVATNNVVLADTLLMPYARWNYIASTRLTETNMTILEFIRANNVYSATTGAPLTIRAIRKLDTAGVSSTARMIAYRRNPEVLKLHIPMPHRFLPVWQTGPLRWDVPGVMRFGGLDIRLPSEVSYTDGI